MKDAFNTAARQSGQQRQPATYRLDWSALIPEVTMSPHMPPIPEFETEEQAASHDRWFRAKVQAALDDPRPGVSHEQVMADMRALIESKRNRRDAD